MVSATVHVSLISIFNFHCKPFRRYVNSVQNGPRVARYVARFVKFLIENGVNMELVHLIGFSLGAEVAGFAGKTLKEWNMELPRITGKRL